MIQTSFRSLYICEFKFSQQLVGKSVIGEVQKKMHSMQVPKGFSLWPVLVQVNGVQDEVVNGGFFAKIINFGDILDDGKNSAG